MTQIDLERLVERLEKTKPDEWEFWASHPGWAVMEPKISRSCIKWNFSYSLNNDEKIEILVRNKGESIEICGYSKEYPDHVQEDSYLVPKVMRRCTFNHDISKEAGTPINLYKRYTAFVNNLYSEMINLDEQRRKLADDTFHRHYQQWLNLI